MKKFILLLLICVITVVGLFYEVEPTSVAESDGAVISMRDTAPPLSFEGQSPANDFSEASSVVPNVENEFIEDVRSENNRFSDDIPLSYEEQELLQSACEEFDVPYALALGLIEKETIFQNIVGDDGASTGYMQVQEKWHQDRMNRLGVTDLLDPGGNFRVGLDFLSDLYGKYNDWSVALTVYNMGHNPGYITDYAKAVMENYAHWQEIIDNYI